MEPKSKTNNNTCYSCSSDLELFEVDLTKGTKVMKCQNCSLFHLYKKDFFGGWKMLKATKDPSHIHTLE